MELKENVDLFVNNSYERIKRLDSKMRLVEHVQGKVEPDIENMQLGEAKKFRLAVLHVDINDFKKLAQDELKSNVSYLRFVTIFLTEITQIILDLDGMIDRYVGDQITALFGIDHECEFCGAERTLRCGLNVLTSIKYSLNRYFSSIDLPTISCSLGADFGDVQIAKVGLKGNNQFTLVGSTVNIAAQLLELAPPGNMLIGEKLYNGMSDSEKNFCIEQQSPEWKWIISLRTQDIVSTIMPLIGKSIRCRRL